MMLFMADHPPIPSQVCGTAHVSANHQCSCLTAGVAFTGSCRPEFCVQLKAQLDSYLLTVPAQTTPHESLSSCNAAAPRGCTLGNAKEIEEFLLRNGKCNEIFVSLVPVWCTGLYKVLEALQLLLWCCTVSGLSGVW